MAEFEVGNVSTPDSEHMPSPVFPPNPNHTPTLCSRSYPTNSTLVYFAHTFLKLSSGDEGACGYVERGRKEWNKKRKMEKRKERRRIHEAEKVQPSLDELELPKCILISPQHAHDIHAHTLYTPMSLFIHNELPSLKKRKTHFGSKYYGVK